MANWNKLNQEFSTLIDNLTDEDWNNWQANREAKKTMRRLEMQLRAKIQADKITLSSRIGHQILNETEMSSGWICVDPSELLSGLLAPGENSFALAA